MCGIAGYYDQKGVDQDTLIKMNKILSHRGPDDEGTWKSDYIGFSHTRLSIIDLSQNGRQPMEPLVLMALRKRRHQRQCRSSFHTHGGGEASASGSSSTNSLKQPHEQ